MEKFRSLTEIVDHIMDQADEEDVSNYRWVNDAGEWDLGDIENHADMYDALCNVYYLDVVTYDIYDGDFEDGTCIFTFIEDAE